jgi:amino acid transporter
MLFFYRNIYAEVVTAIPVNGGNYNAVLNVSSKKSAAVVSCLSILSYVATAIISGFSSILYLKILWADLDIRIGTILILILFAVVTLCGVGESAGVSTMIFLFHTLVLSLLIIWGFVHGIQDNFETFHENMLTDYPVITTSSGSTLGENNIGLSIFCGYCLGMLGITGAETPANYVEEMKDSKVLLGTINWMW